MSKATKRKITLEAAGKPSVFERLGTKKAGSGKPEREVCRQWAAHGVCAYGKSCKFAATHALVSPSKRAAGGGGGAPGKEEPPRLHSAVVRADELESWDQTELEYADTDALEKRRLQLQRELELQLRMESGGGKERPRKKPPSSSSSSRSSSTSSASSSTSGGSSSSSSSARNAKKKGRRLRKRHSSSSSEGDVPPKKKQLQKEVLKQSKSVAGKKPAPKKDDRIVKKVDPVINKKKVLMKMTLNKKSLSPGKKNSGTPPITSKGVSRTATKHSKSPLRREKNRSVSPKDKDRDRREREREREKIKARDRTRPKSRSPRKARSPILHRDLPKDPRRIASSERSRPVSPKKARRDQSTDKHKKPSPTRDRTKDNKDRSSERRKDKHDDKDRHAEKARRERERPKDTKRESTSKRAREHREPDRGLEKPSKPMERLLPRPEERLAALAAISNRNVDQDKASVTSKDRLDPERGRKQDRDRERDRSSKRGDRMSMDRDHGDYDRGMERPYDGGHSIERGYERGDRYEEGPPGERDNRSPGAYGMQGRDRHYDPGYDPRGYPEGEDRGYGEHISDHRERDIGFEERRPRRDLSWDGRSGSLDRERPYHPHPHKEWEGEEFHVAGEWGRDRHWQHHDPQIGEWGEKEGEVEPGWRPRGRPPAPHRPRLHEEGYGRNMRMEHPRPEPPTPGKRRPGPQRSEAEPSPVIKPEVPAAPAPPAVAAPAGGDAEEPPVPDDLSEISDDPDDILNRDDMVEQRAEEESLAVRAPSEERTAKVEPETLEPTVQEAAPLCEEKPEGMEAKEEDKTNEEELDFEEISEGELEEERTRAGLGDALGVDWASLVAEVRRGKQPPEPAGGAQQRWLPARALAGVGVSLAMAGADYALAEQAHPVASIQVAIERRKRQRAALFGSGCDATRALSARRDLALRRHLCRLPPVERSGHARIAPQPHLFHAVRALLLQSSG